MEKGRQRACDDLRAVAIPSRMLEEIASSPLRGLLATTSSGRTMTFGSPDRSADSKLPLMLAL